MKFSSLSHIHGETIVRSHFPSEANDILDVIGKASVPLRNKVKRQKRGSRDGQDLYMLFPADLPKLNQELDKKLRAREWKPQPYASEDIFADTGDRSKGDFVKNKVFVEVEFGNTASLFRDLFKFQVASRERQGEVAVLVVAHKALARFHDSGITDFEKVEQISPYLSLTIQMPIWIIGLRPETAKLQRGYEAMKQLAPRDVTYRTWNEAQARTSTRRSKPTPARTPRGSKPTPAKSTRTRSA